CVLATSREPGPSRTSSLPAGSGAGSAFLKTQSRCTRPKQGGESSCRAISAVRVRPDLACAESFLFHGSVAAVRLAATVRERADCWFGREPRASAAVALPHGWAWFGVPL